MKLRVLLPFALLLAAVGPARATEPVFPGLQAVLTAAEWQRAGLDRLTPDQLGVIDAALIRHLLRSPAPVSTSPIPPAPAAAAAPKPGLFERFGLTRSSGPDWRSQPPLEARATGWLTVNRFTLDNGQVWEGTEGIPFDVAGQDVVIEARPGETFVVKLKSGSAPVRVRRVK
ncbi:MAG: hypothetical protein NTV51_26370 [Verrucomicrobia bacterium]|nr:hypothetical protein [Verrucomicrobiota bacterium]